MSLPRISLSRPLRWFVLAALLAGATAALPGRDDEKPPEKKPADKGMRVEEEDDTYKPGKPVLRVEEPDVIDRTARMFPRPVSDLKVAAREAKSGYLRKIYRDLEVPHDLVIFNGSDRKERVQPFDLYIAERTDKIRGGVEVTPFEAEWKPGKAHTINTAAVEKVRHYEQLAHAAVVEVLANDKDLLRHERLSAAEQILSSTLSFHETARRGEDWKILGNELRKEMLNVLLEEVRETGEAKDWGEAADLTRQLTTTYKSEAEQVRIANALGELLLKALNEPSIKTARLREVRQQVRVILDQFPANPAVQGIAANLRQQAGHLLAQAKKAVDDKQLPQAEELLQLATELDPQSQELRDLRTMVNGKYPVLRVGVRELPRFFSPARATTDSELRAVELLFEGLVKVMPGPDGAARYRPSLAESRPKIVPLGREFLLPRNATWPGDKAGQPDKPVSAADVRYSVDKLKEGLGGRSRAWGDLLKEVEIGDPTRVMLTMTRGHLEPLALMTFKIIPEGTKADDDAFAQKPIGSGPFRLGEEGKDDRGDYRSFLSNPAYGSRPGRSGLPHIREIRFYASKDPVKELLREGGLDLALDLTAVQAAALAANTKILVPPAGPNWRVYFLAVNHQAGGPLASAVFRQGLACAIKREELLDEHFRKGWNQKIHKALNGPFPADSWACAPPAPGKKTLDLFDPTLAELNIPRGLEAARVNKVQLSLKYPTGDPRLAGALEDLRKRVLLVSKDRVTLDLMPLPPHELRKAVETQNYQLAYYHYDFPDETYWLGPLLGQDGNNIMQYKGSDLQNLIREATNRREFDRVHKEVVAMHRVLEGDMPLIPLWQLDPLSAYREDLKPTYYDRTMGLRKEVEKVPFDPLLVFPDAENWRKERQ